MEVNYRMAAILFLLATLCSVCASCEVDDVAVYKVKLKLLDGAEPKTQWSQVFGQSHNPSYALYRIGDVTRPLVNSFLQFGSLDPLMEEGEGEAKVYDQFTAPALDDGKESHGIVFVDGGHSLVSLISRLISSSNWFIGVDSLDLCVHSSWIDEVTLDLDPLAAGFGFSLEDNKPVEKISHQTTEGTRSKYYYRNPRQVESIVEVEFVKVKEYSTKQLNDLARKEVIGKMKAKANRNLHKRFNENHYKEEFSTKNPFEQLKDLEEDPFGTPRPNNPDNNVVVVTKAPKVEAAPSGLKNMDEVVLAVAHGRKLGLGRHLPRHFKSRLHHAVNKHRGKDCVVSEWNSWSSCSDPCEEQTRERTIIQNKMKGGKDCGELMEKRPCEDCVRGDGDYTW